MSMFYCHGCCRMRDSDDGCEEYGGNLLCLGCSEEYEADMAELEARAGAHMTGWEGEPVNLFGGKDNAR